MSDSTFNQLGFVLQVKYLLKHRITYRRVLLSQIVSLLGDWLSYVAISLIVIQQDQGNAMDLAFVFIAHALPMAILAPVTGMTADRFNRKHIMLMISVLCSITTYGLLYTAYHHHMIWVQMILFLRTSLACFANTARQASISQIVYTHELYVANTFHSMTWSLLFTLGVAVGGVLCSIIGPYWTMAIDGITFLLAFIILYRIPPLPPQTENILSTSGLTSQSPSITDPTNQQFGLSKVDLQKASIFKVWRQIRAFPQIRLLLLSKSPNAAITAVGWMALNLLLLTRYGAQGAGVLGGLHAIRGIGTALGPLVLKKYSTKLTQSSTWLTLIAVIVFIWSDSHVAQLISLCVWGMGTGHNWVLSSTKLQAQASSRILGRLTAIDFLFLTLAQSVACLLIAYAYDAHYTLYQASLILLLPLGGLLLWMTLIEYSHLKHYETT